MFRFLEPSVAPLRRATIFLWILLPAAGCASHPDVCGLRPLSPELTVGWASNIPRFTEIDSLQPALRWEAFPRPSDLRSDPDGIFAKARDVTYELRIWRVEEGGSMVKVYDRTGLPDPAHRMEEPLQPSANHFWSVRARFRVGEETRVIPWGFTKVPHIPWMKSCIVSKGIPPANLFRFRTP